MMFGVRFWPCIGWTVKSNQRDNASLGLNTQHAREFSQCVVWLHKNILASFFPPIQNVPWKLLQCVGAWQKKKRFQVAYTCTWKKEEIPGGYSKCMTSTSGTLWRFSTRDVSMSCKFIKCSAFLMGETTRLLPVLKKEVVTFKEMRPVVSKTCHLISLIFTFWHNLSLWVEI